MEIGHALAHLETGSTLTEAESEAIFTQMLSGTLTDAQIAELLTLLASRTPTVEELTGAARVMRSHVTRVATSIPPSHILDTCGTGGAPKTFNVSTAAAIVVASTGILKVAKHGNRSRTGRGSAEVLASLGVNIEATTVQQTRCLEEAGVCFCFAVHHHPAAKFASAARKALSFPTIFNLLGPLTNPAGASRQLIGVYRPELVDLVSRTLARLGSEQSLVVHGEPGLDELSIFGRTHVARVQGKAVTAEHLNPAALGFRSALITDVSPATLADATTMLINVLQGQEGPARDMVVLSSAAALSLAGTGSTIAAKIGPVQQVIDSGKAYDTLQRLARLSHERA